MVYVALERLANYWRVSGKPIPNENEILKDQEVMGFVSELCKLSYEATILADQVF